MASSRRNSNGRSSIVNQQRQITAFFTKSTSSPSPIIPSQNSNKLSSKHTPDQIPNANLSRNPSSNTPDPFQTKIKKPLLEIGAFTPSPSVTPDKSCGEEAVGRRIKVYWPLDKRWYEGVVKSCDKNGSKHLVQYDDGDEEMLDLGKEKFEWVEESVKRFKRLRLDSLSSLRKMVIDDEEAKELEDEDESNDGGGDVDDSTDEDWKNVAKEVREDCEEDEEDTELDSEEGDEENGKVKLKANQRQKEELRKRKMNGGGKVGSSAKKTKSSGDVNNASFKVATVETTTNAEHGKMSMVMNATLSADTSERFSTRVAEKFSFLGEDRKDAKMRRPGDLNYDPKTIYLHSNFLKSLSGGQRQWWEFKSKHMDKVLFFKMGKFYELFEMDAHVGAKELDLQYMKGEQPHCGFPERNFSMNVEKLARKGYRVLVVEQTETPEQLELRRKEKGSKDKVVKREICAVVTKGTLTEGEMLSANPDASYIMAVTENCHNMVNQCSERVLGVCVVDVATNRVILGQFEDDLECSALSCLLTELRPVEIIKPTKLLSPETEKVLWRHTRSPLVNELVPLVEFWDAEKTVHEVKNFYKHAMDKSVSGYMESRSSHLKEDDLSCLPDVLSELIRAVENGSSALSALGGILFYLKQAFLDETLLKFAKFEFLPSAGFGDIITKPYLVLDSAALENLEIFENSINGGSLGTLYAHLNHCVTAFGKRLLKTWLARPLYSVELIKERQQAVASLRGVNLPFSLEFRKILSRLPDMERLLVRVFSSSEASGRNASKVVLYEDAAKKKLQELVSALRGCELMYEACSALGVILKNVESRQLHYLLTTGKGLPEIKSILTDFKNAFDWVEANNTGRIIPHVGGDMDYDSACKKCKEIECSLAKYLKEQRKLLGDTSVTYVTVGKEAYLLEVPESSRGCIPRDYELRSSRKGFFRYWTPNIKNLLGELSQAESEKESSLKNILQRLIGRFCEHHTKWKQLVSATAELDVLISLAVASDFCEGPTCQPTIISMSCANEVPSLSAKSLGHPVLQSDSLGKGAFVPNDITIGGPSNSSFILLTGPNMGGKSTLLRQVCLAVILAQLGADVPAESFKLSPVDRIFVRMGSKDHIMAGQSTFLTELSETAAVLSSATLNSLVVLDELGRGTSTSDGQAIAESVLDHLVNKVQCRGMFSTHYHRLAVDFHKNPKVSLCHMACQVGNGAIEEVTFLYRLTPGSCPKSYGVNVARLAGLPDSVLQKAAAMSREFEATYGRCVRAPKKDVSLQNLDDEMVALLQELNNIVTNLSCDEFSKSDDLVCLTDLQSRARMLVLRN